MKRLLVVVWLLCHFALLQAQSNDDGYVSIDGLKKSLGVNMKFKVPEGWKEKQSEFPHVVKSYYNDIIGLSFNILIYELPSFVSRNEFRNQVEDVHKQIETETRKDPDVKEYSEIYHDIVTIDQYPFIVICAEEHRKSSHLPISCLVFRYYTYYEDRAIIVSFFNHIHVVDSELFFYNVASIMSSIRFPDQYSVY